MCSQVLNFCLSALVFMEKKILLFYNIIVGTYIYQINILRVVIIQVYLKNVCIRIGNW